MMKIAVYILTFAVFGTTTTYADRPQSQSVKFRFKETNNLSPSNWVDTQFRINESVH